MRLLKIIIHVVFKTCSAHKNIMYGVLLMGGLTTLKKKGVMGKAAFKLVALYWLKKIYYQKKKKTNKRKFWGLNK